MMIDLNEYFNEDLISPTDLIHKLKIYQIKIFSVNFKNYKIIPFF